MGNLIVFLMIAAVAIGAALGMLLSRNAVHSALFLILNFTAAAFLYVVLNAPFIAMVQITVYAGAIMVLFLFVIMLLGAEQLRGVVNSSDTWQQVLALVLAGLLIMAVITSVVLGGGEATASTTIDTSPSALGLRLFEGYVVPFEVTGVLLLAAMIGLVVLDRRRRSVDASGND